MPSDVSRSSDGDRGLHLETEVGMLRDELRRLTKEFEAARAEYFRHMKEDCGAVASEISNIKEAWAQFTTALQRADQHELHRLVQRINDLMPTALAVIACSSMI